MKLLSEAKERKWYLVEEWVTKAGLKARIHQCVWKNKENGLHDHYTGYVQPPTGCLIDQDIEVHGGVTLNGSIQGDKGRWIGFDMSHSGDEGILNPLEYAKAECESLAKQLISKI